MRKATDQHRTLVDLLTAASRKLPVTVTALKEEKDDQGRKTGELVETVRTLEIYDASVTNEGNILITAMDRETKEKRSFRLDRIKFYTIHRTMTFVIPVEDEPTRQGITDAQVEFLAEMGPADAADTLVGHLLNQADRAEAHGLANVEEFLREAAADLQWVADLELVA